MLQQLGPMIGAIVLCILLMAGSILLINRTVVFQNRLPADRGSLEFVFLVFGWVLLFALMLILGFALFLLVFVFVFIYIQNLRGKQRGFLWMLAIAAQRQIPLAPAVNAYAAEVGGQYGERAHEFANLLSEGVPLPDALNLVPILVPSRNNPIIRSSYESGNLAKGLREAAAARTLQQPLWGSLSGNIFYIVAMIVFGASILTFLMVKIIPSFEKIFKDFSAALPPVTLALIGISRWLVNYWFLFFPFYILFLFLLFHCLLKYLDISWYDLPGTGWLMRRKHAAEIMDCLAMDVENRRTIDAGLHTLVRCYPTGAIRVKLNRVLADVQAGAPWHESLRARGLISPADAAVLQAAERAGNLPWAMREMADGNRRRLAYRLDVLVQTLFPPVVLCFGAMVLFVVVALFMPLITLIQRMS
ncbi:MAG: type II secretion system F family protein [Pirellulales bacterium]|nr:type II secretion system F family protein [Pirellulales bacterium]